MGIENFRWLAAVIASHPNNEVIGRTRLQKTIWLLQRLGLPTDYSYSLHFYGPYSEEIKADIGLTERFGIVAETPRAAFDGTEYFVLTANASASLPDVEPFREHLQLMANEDAPVLELAATYDAFRKMGLGSESAIESLRAKKGEKCASGREARALDLLRRLGLTYRETLRTA
jgi:hypothetical protein